MRETEKERKYVRPLPAPHAASCLCFSSIISFFYQFRSKQQGYTLSTWDAYQKYRALNIQAGTTFCDGAFQKVREGRRRLAAHCAPSTSPFFPLIILPTL
jgi:hypothetical protein